MKSKRPFPPRRQETPETLRDDLLYFIRTKFYPDAVSFSKDRPRLLRWVVLKFAVWLNSRGVTLPPTRYLEIVRDKILMEAVRHGNTGTITYLPAWLGRVIDTHLQHHGDEYYEEAKSIRNLVENAVVVAGRQVHEADPVRELAALDRLTRPQKRPSKPVSKAQLSLL